MLKNGEYLAKLQARMRLSRALSSPFAVRCSGAQSARDNHVLVCNFAKYSPTLTLSNKPFDS